MDRKLLQLVRMRRLSGEIGRTTSELKWYRLTIVFRRRFLNFSMIRVEKTNSIIIRFSSEMLTYSYCILVRLIGVFFLFFICLRDCFSN